MPTVEAHGSDKKLGRIHWQQRGTHVAAHTQDLKQLDKIRSRTQVVSQYVVVAATGRKHEELVASLQNGTSWLNRQDAGLMDCA